jgi:hypothetical protein
MVSIPCVATAALEEKIPRELGAELLERWVQLGLKIECFRQYGSK